MRSEKKKIKIYSNQKVYKPDERQKKIDLRKKIIQNSPKNSKIQIFRKDYRKEAKERQKKRTGHAFGTPILRGGKSCSFERSIQWRLLSPTSLSMEWSKGKELDMRSAVMLSSELAQRAACKAEPKVGVIRSKLVSLCVARVQCKFNVRIE